MEEPVGFGMGWYPSWDARNWEAAPYIDYSAPLPLSIYHRIARILNQGATPSCVGHGGRHDLEATPVPVPFTSGPSAMELYAACQAVDGIPMPHDGTTLQALDKVCRARGVWTSTVWPRSIEEMIRWILGHGPVVIGCNWYQGQMLPDSRGVIAPTGGIVGGHCVCVYGYDQPSGYFRIAQSWGDWGPQHGKCWMFVGHMKMLVYEQGGGCIAPMEPGMV